VLGADLRVGGGGVERGEVAEGERERRGVGGVGVEKKEKTSTTRDVRCFGSLVLIVDAE
jgi:hypothetical protein